MSPDVPIACSLNATELSTRLADMAALGRAALVDARTSPAGAELRFAAGEGVRGRVEAIVAAESECCAFLTMRIGDEADVVVLSIEAPPGAEPVLEELVAAFQADAPATARRGRTGSATRGSASRRRGT